MPDEPILIPGGEEAITSTIHYIYHAILTTYQQNPKLLKENFRKNPWHSHKFQDKFTLKLLEQLRDASNSETLFRRIIKILHAVMEAEFFASAIFRTLINNIRHTCSENGKTILSPPVKTSQESRFEQNGSNYLPALAAATSNSKSYNKDTGIAILLLDAENLFLDEETEEFLKRVCQYEIQIKIAFANWQRMGKKDVELHNLHYELIHVPAGKDSADVKMATVGSSIFVHYPTAKEVLVCSSDEVMSHLCTTLQTHGLTVYRVRKHGKTVTVFNTQTGKTYTHVIGSLPEIPPLDRFLNQIKDIIKYEQAKKNLSWIRLANIVEIYQTKYKHNIAEVIAFNGGYKNIINFFLQFKNDFVLYKQEESSEFYITLFEIPPIQANSAVSPSAFNSFNSEIKTSSINSTSELKEALIAIFKELTAKHPETPITMDALGSNFSRIYGQGITKILSRLKQGSKFPIFLQNCGYFNLTPYGRSYLVTLRTDNSQDSAAMPKAQASSEIKSLADLEVALVNILKEKSVYAPSYTPLGVLGMEFRNRYGKPINTVIKETLKLNSNFITVVQKLNSFKVIQTAKGWEIALAPPAQSSRVAKL